MKRISVILCILLTVLCFGSCKLQNDENKLSATELMMDTVVTLTVWDCDEEVLDGAFDVCRKYEQLFSRTVETSDVSRINNADGAATAVAEETAELITLAQTVSEGSDGAFDITVLPLVELWNINQAEAPPDDAAVTAALQNVSYKNLSIEGNEVTAENGTEIDLGGIAKGYIADAVRDYLVSKGVSRAIINLGGNVTVLGDNGGKPYTVGIQKPFSLHGESAAILMLENKTAVTSGIYERYFEHGGTIYHHIIDPKTGYPVQNGIASVTVIADSSALADSLSTACLVLGVESGMKLAAQYGAETVFIDTNGEITVSEGLTLDPNGTTPRIKVNDR